MTNAHQLFFVGMSVADHTGTRSAWANGRGFLYMLAPFVKIKTAAVSHPEMCRCCSGRLETPAYEGETRGRT